MTTIIKRIVERERRACVHHDVNRCWRSFVFVVVVVGTALFGLIIFDNNQPADKMQIATPLIAETEAVVVEETMSTEEVINSSVADTGIKDPSYLAPSEIKTANFQDTSPSLMITMTQMKALLAILFVGMGFVTAYFPNNITPILTLLDGFIVFFL